MKIFSVLSLSSLIISTPVMAASLDLTTWETFGDVSISNPNQASLSSDGLWDDDFELGVEVGAFNFSGAPAGVVGFGTPSLEDFLGINVIQLDLDGFAYEGSALKHTIEAKAGDILSFNWNFLTNETSDLINPFLGTLNDYAFFLVNGEIIKLAEVQTSQNTSNPFDSETGFSTYNYTFSNSGNYTIAMGVVDIDDFTITSGLVVNDVTLTTSNTTVPESSTLLGLLGLGILGINSRWLRYLVNKNNHLN